MKGSACHMCLYVRLAGQVVVGTQNQTTLWVMSLREVGTLSCGGQACSARATGHAAVVATQTGPDAAPATCATSQSPAPSTLTAKAMPAVSRCLRLASAPVCCAAMCDIMS